MEKGSKIIKQPPMMQNLMDINYFKENTFENGLIIVKGFWKVMV